MFSATLYNGQCVLVICLLVYTHVAFTIAIDECDEFLS